MEGIIGTIIGLIGGGAMVGIIALILKNVLSLKNASSWGKTAAKAVDGLVVKIAGGEKRAENLEAVYSPFIEEFIESFIEELHMDNKDVKETIIKTAEKN